MPIGSHPRAGWTAAVLLCAGCIVGCETTKPTAPPARHAVAVTVEDTTGARIPDALVSAFRLDAGELTLTNTDAEGVAHLSLDAGHWCCYSTFSTGRVFVGCATGDVRAKPAGSVDSVLFRLIGRPQSIARGKVTLMGQSTHDGTLVTSSAFYAFTTTKVDGSYELIGLPPGTWRFSATASRPGYSLGGFQLVVPAPGDTVIADSLALGPLPTLARP